MAKVYKRANDWIAHQKGVKAMVHAKGREVEATAKAFLEPHRSSGDAHIEAHKEDTDYVVELVAHGTGKKYSAQAAVLAIEYGRAGYTTKSGAQIGPAEGLHVLRRAAGI
jgi:hypothetical protein